MIKSHNELVATPTEIVDEVICNCCGSPVHKTCFKDSEDIQGNISDHYVLHDYLHVKQIWGYFSNHDEEYHEFDLCQDCYDKFVSSFKIPIKIKDYM